MTRSPISTLTTSGGGEYRYLWHMIPNIPVVHQRGEAIADLMDLLRVLGMVLLSEPRASIQHGVKPIMTLTLRARYATDHENHALQDPADNDQETAA